MNSYVKFCPNVWVAKCSEKHEKGEIIEIETKRGNTHECEVWNLLKEYQGGYLYSITRVDGTNKATMAKRRADRRNDWADRAETKSENYFEKSENAVAGIPFGQPILVGHHSERAHRNAIEKSWAAMGKSVELSKKVEEHRNKAAYWAAKAEEITLDMPESLEYFKEQLEIAEEYHQGLKSGKYPREHSYSLTYAKKHVNELKQKVEIAEKLWGEQPETNED